MIVRIKFSDAQAVDDAIVAAVYEPMKEIYNNLSDDEVSMLDGTRTEDLYSALSLSGLRAR